MINRALRSFFWDLSQGDPLALALAGFFLFLAVVVASIWIIDLNRRAKEKKGKKASVKGKPKGSNRSK